MSRSNTLSMAKIADAVPLRIEGAQLDDAGRRRIRGIANTFGVMRSRRIMHPGPAEELLKSKPELTLPLLAQHGMVPGFATIGTVDVLKVDRGRGLYFEATIADGDPTADTAWNLVEGGHLNSLSIGWYPRQARFVTEDDKDLDPWFKKKMSEAGASEALAFIDYELLEISLVDVGDDRDAKLVASLGELQTTLETLSKAARSGSANGDGKLVAAAQQAARETVQSMFEAAWKDFANRALELIEDLAINPDDALPAAYLSDEADGGEDPHEQHVEGDQPASGGSEPQPSAALAAVIDGLKQLNDRRAKDG